jgi:hypothetical protein
MHHQSKGVHEDSRVLDFFSFEAVNDQAPLQASAEIVDLGLGFLLELP